jgi:hypothetical protein
MASSTLGACFAFCFLGLFVLFPFISLFPGQDRHSPAQFDVVIKHGTVYDGSGSEPQHVDVVIHGDHIAGVGDFSKVTAETIDVSGLFGETSRRPGLHFSAALARYWRCN